MDEARHRRSRPRDGNERRPTSRREAEAGDDTTGTPAFPADFTGLGGAARANPISPPRTLEITSSNLVTEEEIEPFIPRFLN